MRLLISGALVGVMLLCGSVTVARAEGNGAASALRSYLDPPVAPLVAVTGKRVRFEMFGDMAITGTVEGRPGPSGGITTAYGPTVTRLRVGLAAVESHGLALVARVELGELPTEGRLLEALAGWAIVPELKISGGMGKVPFSRGQLLPAAALLFTNRSPAITVLAPARRVGLTFEGDLGLVTYSAGVYDPGPGFDATGDGALLAGRVEVIPLGPVPNSESAPFRADPWYRWSRLVVGFGALALVGTKTPGSSGRRAYGFAGDVTYYKGPLTLGAEGILGHNVDDEHVAPTTHAGSRLSGTIKGGLFLVPKHLELAIRGDFIDAGPSNSIQERTLSGSLGLNGYLLDRRLRGRVAFTHSEPLLGLNIARREIVWFALEMSL